MKTSILLIAILLIVIIGCAKESSDVIIDGRDSVQILPIGAKDIIDLGNGWVQFNITLDDSVKTFIFYRARTGYKGYCAITQVK